MRIKESIQQNVIKAYSECKKVFIEETINLCKQMGIEPEQDVLFAKPIILVVADNKSSKGMNFNIKPIIADRMDYSDRHHGFALYFGESCVATSYELALSDLDVVFAAMKRVVREYKK